MFECVEKRLSGFESKFIKSSNELERKVFNHRSAHLGAPKLSRNKLQNKNKRIRRKKYHNKTIAN